MVRVSYALISLARDPLPFLLVVLGCRFLDQHGIGVLAGLMGSGYCVSVFFQALRADAAPPMRSKDLPRTAYLGCLGGCGFYLAAAVAVITVGCLLAAGGLEAYNPTAREWTNPVIQLLMLLLVGWLTQILFVSLCLACSRVRGREGVKSAFNGFFVYLGSFLRRPPLNGTGARLLLLVVLALASVECFSWKTNTLVQFLPMFFSMLYAHCLGQSVRKGHGFQLS